MRRVKKILAKPPGPGVSQSIEIEPVNSALRVLSEQVSMLEKRLDKYHTRLITL
jgi:hypothetical protein